MRTSFDSNVFIYGPVSESCSDLINDYVGERYSLLILYEVFKESKNKLLKLNSIITSMLNEYNKEQKILNLLESDSYEELKKDFPQHYKSLKTTVEEGYFDTGENDNFTDYLNFLLVEIRQILSLINDRDYLYPEKEEIYEEKITRVDLQNFMESLDYLGKEADKRILALIKDFIDNKDEKMNFYTTDKEDFLDNKLTIEETVEGISIKGVEGFDPESFQLLSP